MKTWILEKRLIPTIVTDDIKDEVIKEEYNATNYHALVESIKGLTGKQVYDLKNNGMVTLAENVAGKIELRLYEKPPVIEIVSP